MAHFAVIYTYTDDKALQDEHRPEHRAYLGQLAEAGSLVASGPLLGTSPATALLVFKAADEEEVRRLLADDPFQKLGQVARADVTEWNPVIGILAGS